jgi:hypothetical protein
MHILANILQWTTGDVLRTALLLSNSLIVKFPVLATPYVRGILGLSDIQRACVLPDSPPKQTIYWDLPFLLNHEKNMTHTTQWCQAVILGQCRYLQAGTGELDRKGLHLLSIVIKHVYDKKLYDQMDSGVLDFVFSKLNDAVLSNLTINDLTDMAWTTWTRFIKMCSKDLCVQVIHITRSFHRYWAY